MFWGWIGDSSGKPTITAHRFRHTVGTQLAERGAKLHTIMKVLGHISASMTMTYAQISDREVLKDYQAVLGPGAMLAGPFAETLKTGQLSAPAVDWLTENFSRPNWSWAIAYGCHKRDHVSVISTSLAQNL